MVLFIFILIFLGGGGGGGKGVLPDEMHAVVICQHFTGPLQARFL